MSRKRIDQLTYKLFAQQAKSKRKLKMQTRARGKESSISNHTSELQRDLDYRKKNPSEWLAVMLSKEESEILAYMNGTAERGTVSIENFETSVEGKKCIMLLSFVFQTLESILVSIDTVKFSKTIGTTACFKRFAEDQHFSISETRHEWILRKIIE